MKHPTTKATPMMCIYAWEVTVSAIERDYLTNKYLVLLPGGQWQYINYLEMVQNALFNWVRTDSKIRLSIIRNSLNACVLMAGNTTFVGHSPEESRVKLNNLAQILHKGLPHQTPCYVIAEHTGQASANDRETQVMVFANIASPSPCAVMVTPKPLTLDTGEYGIAKKLVSDYPTQYNTTFPGGWKTTYHPHGRVTADQNYPVAQIFWETPKETASGVVMAVSSAAKAPKEVQYHKVTEPFLLSLERVHRPVLLQLGGTKQFFEFYF
jgi:hypothetical protein